MVISWHFLIISVFLIRISCKTYNILDNYFFGMDMYHVMLTKRSTFLTLRITIVTIFNNPWSIIPNNSVFSSSLGYLILFLFLMIIAMMINVDHDQWPLIKDNDFEIVSFSLINLVFFSNLNHEKTPGITLLFSWMNLMLGDYSTEAKYWL